MCGTTRDDIADGTDFQGPSDYWYGSHEDAAEDDHKAPEIEINFPLVPSDYKKKFVCIGKQLQ